FLLFRPVAAEAVLVEDGPDPLLEEVDAFRARDGRSLLGLQGRTESAQERNGQDDTGAFRHGKTVYRIPYGLSDGRVASRADSGRSGFLGRDADSPRAEAVLGEGDVVDPGDEPLAGVLVVVPAEREGLEDFRNLGVGEAARALRECDLH